MPKAGYWLLMISVLTGCAPRSIPIAQPTTTAGLQPSYIDLQAGWRLRVVTPLTKSGNYQLNLNTQSHSGPENTFKMPKDFIGYETAFYRIQPRRLGGVHVRFASAEKVIDGVSTPQASPAVRLFQLPGNAHYVRLLYLARVSASNHDMAVIAAAKQNLLAQLTAEIQLDPSRCVKIPSNLCSWIPAGIAVRPESLASASGDSWAPVH